MVQNERISLNFDCSKGDAIFHTSFCIEHNINPSEIKRLSSDFLDSISYLNLLDDDRLIALVGELIIENALDKYLTTSMQGYQKELMNKREFYISWKIALAKSLRLSPPKTFVCVDIIRRIRNEFAHNLEITNFEEINTDLIKDLDNGLVNINHKITDERNLREKFLFLTTDTIIALLIFTKDVHLLNSYLKSDNFHKNLLEYSKTRGINKS